VSAPAGQLAGRVFERGQPGFEEACRATVRNLRRPARRPDCVVKARSAEDVQAAVRLANRREWRIAVASGGHSWSGSHLRDDGMLLDVSALRDQTIDVEARTAWAGPGVRSSDLQRELAEHDLFFPSGHCLGPCLGGYLLQGGFGWNSRALGPACMSVREIDVVTADGELVRAGEGRHERLLWSARGAGPGFFGVVTGFHLRLHPRPRCTLVSVYRYSLELLDEVMGWVHEVARSVPRSIELLVFVRRGVLGGDEPGLELVAPALADSEAQAREDLRFLEDGPLPGMAADADAHRVTDVAAIVEANASTLYPDGHRYAVDNMWTGASFDELAEGYRTIARTMPPRPSHMMWMNWCPPTHPQPPCPPAPEDRPDMAFSCEDQTYIGLYGIWEAERDDSRFASWATDRMRELEPVSSGIQLADENLAARPAPFMAPENLRRLEEIRAEYDPAGRFHTWMAAA
jgi:FAD/FMN-containing dehydrogenase